MRILFLLTQDLESPSGVGRYLPLARELVHLGHEMHIAALHPNFTALTQKDFEKDGLRVHYVAPMHVKKANSQKSYYSGLTLLAITLQATLYLTGAALQSRVDIIHLGKPHPMNSLAGLAARAFKGCKLFLDCDDDETASGHFTGRWQRWVVAQFENGMPRRAQMVTTNTLSTLYKLKANGVPAERLVHIPNGVDRYRFAPPLAAEIDALRARLGLQGRRVVLYVGSLSMPSHPVDLLVQAFAAVHRALPETTLLLVGGGEAIDPLKQQAADLYLQDATLFTGQVSPDQVSCYYRLADVSIDPVRDDAVARGRSPLKMFESWASGVPFITAGIGDRHLLAGSPSAAMFFHPGDPASLANAILQLLSSTSLCADLAERGLRQVENYYWDRIARDAEWIYRS